MAAVKKTKRKKAAAEHSPERHVHAVVTTADQLAEKIAQQITLRGLGEAIEKQRAVLDQNNKALMEQRETTNPPGLGRALQPACDAPAPPKQPTADLLGMVHGSVSKLVARIGEFEGRIQGPAPQGTTTGERPSRSGVNGCLEDVIEMLDWAHMTVSRIGSYTGFEV